MGSALTATVCLHTRRHNDGSYQLRIRLSLDRQSVFLATGFSVLKSSWNPRGGTYKADWIRKGHPQHVLINDNLRILVYRAIDTSRAYPLLTAKEVRDRLKVPIEESEADLRRRAKVADAIRRTESNTPVVLRNYLDLVQKMQQLQRQFKELKAQVATLLAERRGPTGN